VGAFEFFDPTCNRRLFASPVVHVIMT
jgi:hypothetical protein